MKYFYKPEFGVVGDTIPYHHDGRYHVFYLRDNRDRDSHGIGSTWHHVSTTDFVRFDDHGVALEKGTTDEQDLTVATGSVVTDGSGLHHIFYTGINPCFHNESQRSQAVMHATSKDLLTWKKIPGEIWYADDSRYERHDWRDPFVFHDEATGRYTMLLAARLATGSTAFRGCTAMLTSDDLQKWTLEEPLYAPGRYHGHECPDLFRIGDWYYLVFSEYGSSTTTRYVMSQTTRGPWIAPANNRFDNRAFYAAKTASDGNRRFLFGWNPTKQGDDDTGDWQWGGCMTVHEVLQNEDGTLAVRLPPEATRAFGEPISLELDLTTPGWTRHNALQVDAMYRRCTALGVQTLDSYVLEGTLRLDRETGEAGVLLRMDDNGDSGYFLRFSAEDQLLQFGTVGGYRHWFVDHMPELDRPLEIRAGAPLTFKVIVDRSATVAYINDQIALSARMYSNPFGRCGLYADGTVASFSSVALRPIVGGGS